MSQSIIERKRPKGSLPLLKGACVDDDSILQNVTWPRLPPNIG